MSDRQKKRLGVVAAVFLKLGFTAFGGPAAAIAMMRQECVVRRGWLSEDDFLDFLGITNLVPGPNATELAIHIGYRRAGWPGLVTAGVCYILPAMLIVLGLAWGYVHFGALPALDGILYGIKPVVAAVLISALMGMLRPRRGNLPGLILVGLAFAIYLFGAGPLWVLLGGGIILGFLEYFREHQGGLSLLGVGLSPVVGTLRALIAAGLQAAPFTLGRLLWVFLKAGALMYGSGYVLLAFIRQDLVENLGWLSDGELVDAIAIGQVTPGPLSTTATFVGYVMGGLPAALLATLAMFLPGFLFVAVTHPLLGRLRESSAGGGFLDGVTFAALGLMAGVTWQVGRAALVDPLTAVVGTAALVLLWRMEVDPLWLILGGALVGAVRALVL